jgi:hypothetical protein
MNDVPSLNKFLRDGSELWPHSYELVANTPALMTAHQNYSLMDPAIMAAAAGNMYGTLANSGYEPPLYYAPTDRFYQPNGSQAVFNPYAPYAPALSPSQNAHYL